MKMTRRMLSMLSAIKLAVTPKHGTEWMSKEALQEFCDSRGWIVDFMDSDMYPTPYGTIRLQHPAIVEGSGIVCFLSRAQCGKWFISERFLDLSCEDGKCKIASEVIEVKDKSFEYLDQRVKEMFGQINGYMNSYKAEKIKAAAQGFVC